MYQLGIDVGTATVKLVLVENTTIISYWEAAHHNQPSSALQREIAKLGAYLESQMDLQADSDLQANSQTNFLAVGITGADAEGIYQKLDGSTFLEEIPAIVEGTKFLTPSANSIIEIGSQGSRFINQIGQVPQCRWNWQFL